MRSMGRHAQASPTQPGTAPRRRNPRGVIYLILALLVFLSPVVLTYVKNIEQHRIAEEYSRAVSQLDDDTRRTEFERARAYNAHLPEVGAPDPWLHGPDTTSAQYQEYERILSTMLPMARIRVPNVGIDLPVYHGTSTSVLSHGVGHLYGTALPVGGEGTRAVLTGHTGLATLTMFDNLTKMREGDVFTVEVMGEVLAYRVRDIATVLPHEIEYLRPEPGMDLLTLVTCTPYGVNSHRLLVTGERTEVPVDFDQDFRSPWQLWMTVAIALVLFIILYLLWWLWWNSRRRKTTARPQPA